MNKPFAFGAAEEMLSQAITGFASKDKLGSVIPLFSSSHHVYPYLSIQVRKSLRSASLFFPTHVLPLTKLQHVCL